MSPVTYDSSFLVYFSLCNNSDPQIVKLPDSYFLMVATKEEGYVWFDGVSTR